MNLISLAAGVLSRLCEHGKPAGHMTLQHDKAIDIMCVSDKENELRYINTSMYCTLKKERDTRLKDHKKVPCTSPEGQDMCLKVVEYSYRSSCSERFLIFHLVRNGNDA